MKNIILKIMSIITCLLILSSCGDNKNKEENPSENENTKPEIVVPSEPLTDNIQVKSEDGTIVLNATLDIPNLREYVSEEAFENINAYYDNVFSKKRTMYEYELAERAKEQYQVAKENNSIFSEFYIEEAYRIQRNDDKMISIQRTSTQFTGGSHDNVYVECETFVKESGAQLLLFDMFKDDNYKDILISEIKKQVHHNIDNETMWYYENVDESIEQLFDNTEYYLTNDSLVICYQTYDLAPYAAGVQQFEIKYTDIKNILKDEWN